MPGSSLNEKDAVLPSEDPGAISPDIDLSTYHEKRAGRLVLDPTEAHIEFGDEVASRLKLSPDGKTVLWPQPTDDPEDPQNWSEWRKAVQLAIITLAAVVPDFDSAIGIASIFALAKQYDTTTGVINDLTSNWSIFLIGWGSLFAVMLMPRYGRLPVLFWSQAPSRVWLPRRLHLRTQSKDLHRDAMLDSIFWNVPTGDGTLYCHGYVPFPPPSAKVEHLDDGGHHFTFPFAFRVWVPRR
jgi:hypothetical protein